MAVSPVAPTASSPYVGAVSGNAGTTNAANIRAIATYEQILALRNQSQLLTGSTNSANDNGLLTADLLSLSPAALNVLNGVSDSTTFGLLGATDITSTFNGEQLTVTEQQQIVAIVGQFANQPLTQDTFTQIQNALRAAGINPQQLSLQQLLGAYAYAYVPGFSFTGSAFTDTSNG